MREKKSTSTKDQLYEVTLTNNIEISPYVYVISFQRIFDFIPGQVVKIGVNNEHPPRIYSICSGKNDEEISILFNIKEDGFLTPKLATLIPGDTIFISKPYGGFLGTKEPAWWIATGTGVAPFNSMLNSGLGNNKTLIHGVKYLNQFYFEDEIEEKLGERYIRCCSRESSCDVFPGRVTDYLDSRDISPNINYFICGQALMAVEVRDLLIEKGVSFEKIFTEIYF